MSQLERPHQGPGLGRGQRPQGAPQAEVDQGVRRLLGADDHRGAHPLRRDGRVVPPREEERQVFRLRIHPPSDQRGDQGRGAGRSESRLRRGRGKPFRHEIHPSEGSGTIGKNCTTFWI